MLSLVSDVMTHTVVALRDEVAFKDIARTMRRWRVSALPVLDEDGRVVGVVSEADLLPKEMLRDGDPDRFGRSPVRPDPAAKADAVVARDLMTAPAVTVRADDTVARAARLMAHRHLKRLPVVDDDGVLLGVVSRSDLIKVFLRDDTEIADEIRREVVARFPAAPTGPVRVEVHDGVVTLTGRVWDASLVALVTRLVRTVEGVVDVDCALSGPARPAETGPHRAPSDDRTERVGEPGAA
ncbi:CBS domain-containing protein [Streptomyces antibioticus]|uniref:CBS domain-containing protein n=1 Tax=Streptomyces antibioticus TaxID=1890 RepID=UPI003701B582